MNYDIKDKTILVTGANRGIGKAIVESFIEHGATKVYAAVRQLNSVSSLVEQYGLQVVPIQLDLGDPQSIVAAAKTAQDVQIVVNNAGVFQAGTPLALFYYSRESIINY
ncbi:MAG: SDR family NAD(P)-dependent oxidoreductase [Nostoc sp.]|uniref:SDR family NAD(P)-dependent oxidoreductase n=1 Tax=Nostoc sp. TaxID=1180 RepID=UPI002FFC7D49